MENFRFTRELRLLTPSHYSRIFNEPARATNQYFTLLAKPNNLEHPRIGLTIAKKRVKKAVQRNRLKRLARECFRLTQHQLDNIDIVLMVKNGVDELSNDELNQQLTKLIKKINERCQPGYKPKPRPKHWQKHKNAKKPANKA